MKTEKIKNVPELRFPEFDGELESTILGDITKWSSGGTPSKIIPRYWEGDIPWISASTMRGTQYSTSDLHVSVEGIKAGSKLAAKGTLLLLVRGSMLWNCIPVGIATRDVAFNQDVKSLVPIKSLTSEYLLYWFLAEENKLLHKVVGTGIGAGKLDTDEMKLLDFMLPTLPEQQKIADFLTAVDGRLAQLSRKKALLEDYKKGVMQQLFTQALRFKDDNGNEFPEWEEKTLGDTGSFKNGLNKDKADFGIGSPFVNLMDVFGKRVLNRDAFGLVNASKKELESYDLKAGDVLFIRSSVKREGVGEAIVVAENIKGAVYSGFLIRFRSTGGKLTSSFMMYCFAARAFGKEVLSYATTSANTNINQESLAQVSVQIPSLPEQTKIANFLSALDDKIEAVGAQITHIQTWKKGLLQQMFV